MVKPRGLADEVGAGGQENKRLLDDRALCLYRDHRKRAVGSMCGKVGMENQDF